MAFQREDKVISGLRCHILTAGAGPTAFLYWPILPGREETVDRMPALLRPDRPVCIAAWEVEDWFRDLSPWPLEQYPGAGERVRETLDRLLHELIPGVEGESGPAEERYLCGYSLAGLFALWAFYETAAFRGAGSVSGSLWCPGWADFAAAQTTPPGSRVYLSLGTGEAGARNRAFGRVGEATRQFYDRLCREAPAVRSTLEWNPGGHFTEEALRMARAIRWLLWEQGREHNEEET